MGSAASAAAPAVSVVPAAPVPVSVSSDVKPEVPKDRPVPRYNWNSFRRQLGKDKGLLLGWEARVSELRLKYGKALPVMEARLWGQAEWEWKLEEKGLLSKMAVEGGFGIEASEKKRDPGSLLDRGLELEGDRGAYVELARRVKGLNRRCTPRQAVQWAMEHGLLPVGEIAAETVPGVDAVSMLWFFRVSPEKVLDLWKTQLSKADMEELNRLEATGENVIGMLSSLSDGLLDPASED